jgi:hypothetical protein
MVVIEKNAQARDASRWISYFGSSLPSHYGQSLLGPQSSPRQGDQHVRLRDQGASVWIFTSESDREASAGSYREFPAIYSHRLCQHFGQDGDVNPFTKQPHSAQYKKILALRRKLPVYAQMAEFYEMVSVCSSSLLERVVRTRFSIPLGVPQRPS